MICDNEKIYRFYSLISRNINSDRKCKAFIPPFMKEKETKMRHQKTCFYQIENHPFWEPPQYQHITYQ